MVVKWLTRWFFSESAKVTDDRYEKNIIAPGLAGLCRLTAQRLLMGFWHASDDIVAGGRQVPRDLPSPPRGQNLSGPGALAISSLPPYDSLSNKKSIPARCSVETGTV